MQRDDSIRVSQILADGWETQLVQKTDKPPHYVCNIRGQEMRALPTFCKVRGSRAFRDKGPGMLTRTIAGDSTSAYREPDYPEKLAAMGFSSDMLNVPGVSVEEAHALVGNAIDLTALTRLVALAESVAQSQVGAKIPQLEACSLKPAAEESKCEDSPSISDEQQDAKSGQEAGGASTSCLSQSDFSDEPELEHWRSVFRASPARAEWVTSRGSTKCPTKSPKILNDGVLGCITSIILHGGQKGKYDNLRKNLLAETTRDYQACMKGIKYAGDTSGLGSNSSKETASSVPSLSRKSPAKGRHGKSPRRSPRRTQTSQVRFTPDVIRKKDGEHKPSVQKGNFVSGGRVAQASMEGEVKIPVGMSSGDVAPTTEDGAPSEVLMNYNGPKVREIQIMETPVSLQTDNFAQALQKQSEQMEEALDAKKQQANPTLDIYEDKKVMAYLKNAKGAALNQR